jgi:N utilization substance protein B
VKDRRLARRLALDVLYEAEVRDMLPVEAYRERERLGWSVDNDDEVVEEPSREVLGYARTLVQGVQDKHADIDELITRYADHWAISRMPVVDRNVIRVALWELVWGGDVPVAVAINEAVELAKSYSTEDSGRFVNGILGKIVEDRSVGE